MKENENEEIDIWVDVADIGLFGGDKFYCSAAPHQWDYNGITGIVGSLLGLDLMIPLVVCIVIFIIGGVFCYKGIQEK